MEYIYIKDFFDPRIRWFTRHEGFERLLTEEEMKTFQQAFYDTYTAELDTFPPDGIATKKQKKKIDEWLAASNLLSQERLGFHPFFYTSDIEEN